MEQICVKQIYYRALLHSFFVLNIQFIQVIIHSRFELFLFLCLYIEHVDKNMIMAKSQKENGQPLEVLINFGSGEVTKKGSFSEIKYTKDEIKDLKKYASGIFDVCEPNVETKQFEEFFDKCLDGKVLTTTQETEIGDLKITLESREKIEMTFVPKTKYMWRS